MWTPGWETVSRMRALGQWLGQINAGALGALILLFTATLLGGANNSAGAALLSAVLLLALGATLLASPAGAHMPILADNWLSALAFVLLAALTLSPALGFAIAGGPYTLNASRTLEGVAALFAPAAAFWLGSLAAPDSERRDWVGRWLCVFTLAYAAIALTLYFSGAGQRNYRLDAALSSANAAASLFGVLAIAALGLIVRGARGRLTQTAGASTPASLRWLAIIVETPLAFAAFVLSLACLLMTASRGGLIASVIALAVFALALGIQSLRWRGARLGLMASPLALAALLFALLFARGGGPVIDRFALAEHDMEVRRILAETHWRLFLERPWFGHGLNSFHDLNAGALTLDNWRALYNAGSVHNIYVQALEETGIAGLVLWVLMLGPLLLRAFVRVVGARSGVEWAAAALAISFLLLLHGLVDFALQVPAIAALFAFMLGAFIGRAEAGPSRQR